MSEEIKQILDIERYRNKDGYVENINLLPDEMAKLFDYITSQDKEIERLKKYEKFIERTIITPENWNLDTGRYVLYGEKQELYKKLYELRQEINDEWRKENIYGSK